MAKGQEQAIEAASICRQVSAQIGTSLGESEGTDVAARLEQQATRLEGLQHRLFLKMGAALRYTEACLAAVREVQAGAEAGASASELDAKVQTVEAAVAALAAKANSPGGVVIT